MTKYLTSKTESGAFPTQVETSVSDETDASSQCDRAPAQRTTQPCLFTCIAQTRDLQARLPLGTTLALPLACRIENRFAAPQFAMAD
jgi:hypothetical protein